MAKEIYITEFDKQRLMKFIEDELRNTQSLDDAMKKLKNEVENAKVVSSQEIPHDVITMNSTVQLHINDEDIEVTLVFPEEADFSNNKMSVLSPIGTAILGYREGDTVEWAVPSGITQIHIKKILYQPEASGDYHR
jgi:regulator of nucleoside diphosphate kinase